MTTEDRQVWRREVALHLDEYEPWNTYLVVAPLTLSNPPTEPVLVAYHWVEGEGIQETGADVLVQVIRKDRDDNHDFPALWLWRDKVWFNGGGHLMPDSGDVPEVQGPRLHHRWLIYADDL